MNEIGTINNRWQFAIHKKRLHNCIDDTPSRIRKCKTRRDLPTIQMQKLNIENIVESCWIMVNTLHFFGGGCCGCGSSSSKPNRYSKIKTHDIKQKKCCVKSPKTSKTSSISQPCCQTVGKYIICKTKGQQHKTTKHDKTNCGNPSARKSQHCGTCWNLKGRICDAH